LYTKEKAIDVQPETETTSHPIIYWLHNIFCTNKKYLIGMCPVGATVEPTVDIGGNLHR